MKILCLQLARFGDIYQTWPTLNALRRYYPEAEIHFVVRERFAAATEGLSSVDKIWSLPNRKIFESILAPNSRVDNAIYELNQFLLSLKSVGYDRIINLSFSPSSSYIVDIIAGTHTVVSGYTRFMDGYLNIPDDASSYFYAQVGVERSNRIHLSDIFAMVAAVELADVDFTFPKTASVVTPTDPYILVHLGASQIKKSCPVKIWTDITDGLLTCYAGQIVFVGSENEKNLLPDIQNDRIISLLGKTQLPELFGYLSEAELLIGGDSVAVQMASLTQTPTLNISFSSVRFWETGPRAKNSRVLWFNEPQDTDADRVIDEAVRMTEGRASAGPIVLKDETFGVLYTLNGYSEDSFEWNLTKALYLNCEFPNLRGPDEKMGVEKLTELARLGLEQIIQLRTKGHNDMIVSILNQIEHLVAEVARLVPTLAPLVRWFQAEKCRIAPGPVEEILNNTEKIFANLFEVGQFYKINQNTAGNLDGREYTWKP